MISILKIKQGEKYIGQSGQVRRLAIEISNPIAAPAFNEVGQSLLANYPMAFVRRVTYLIVGL
ncbi:hypothetical protein ACMYR3_14050 [Ampullimonas aquatilis]|uniref:hypothetical protein n=1 Tax=Ampullimonas aquatilis TaxID=1341549 RepID=UPI003C70B6F3